MLSQMPRCAVETDPPKTAIVQGERRISYEELGRRAALPAGLSGNAGIGLADGVAVALPNCRSIALKS